MQTLDQILTDQNYRSLLAYDAWAAVRELDRCARDECMTHAERIEVRDTLEEMIETAVGALCANDAALALANAAA